jgi:hypothetical protein
MSRDDHHGAGGGGGLIFRISEHIMNREIEPKPESDRSREIENRAETIEIELKQQVVSSEQSKEAQCSLEPAAETEGKQQVGSGILIVPPPQYFDTEGGLMKK